jgi:hypothetical protein
MQHHKKNPDVDVIDIVLKAVLAAQPKSEFVNSLYFQYHERGGLSKKQIQGLYFKAQKVEAVSVAHLATLEAIMLKQPNRFKSKLPENTPLYTIDPAVAAQVNSILAKYPQHKRVVYFKAKLDKNELLSALELTELQRFAKLLL